MCFICPLNGQRKVGHDGPIDADHIGIFEAPGDDEEVDRATWGFPYGRPLQGATGYYVKVRHLAPAGLQELLPNPRKPGSPKLGALKIHLMPVVMCKPPNKKINSPDGKRAQRCCSNSARWFLNERLAENPNRTLSPAGGGSLSMLRGTPTPIEPFRGRVMMTNGNPFPYEPEEDIIKDVLRGQHPKEDWWSAFETWLKSFIKLFKKSSRIIERTSAKQEKAAFLLENTWLTEWDKVYKKQKSAMTRRLKKEATPND